MFDTDSAGVLPRHGSRCLIEVEPLILDGRAMDAEVHLGGTKPPPHLRLIGVQTPKGNGFFLTNLPPWLGPRQVADLYRVRWQEDLCICTAHDGH